MSPQQIYFFDIGKIRYIGLVPIFLGVVIYIFCSGIFVLFGKGSPIPFVPTHRLIVAGLYRFVRNPLYIAGVFVLAGEAFLFQSLGIFLYCFGMFGIFNIQVFIEEQFLANQYGAEYERYRNSVPRWIPRLRPYRDQNSGFRKT